MIGTVVAKIAVDKTALSFDKLFDYVIPPLYREQLQAGCRVLVPFGRGNARRQGLVFAIYTKDTPPKNLKPIHSVIDDKPIVTEDMFGMIRFLVQTTFCTYYDAVNAILPKGLKIHITPTYKLEKRIESIDLNGFAEDEVRLLNFLKKAQTELEIDKFLDSKANPHKRKIVDRLISLGLVKKSEAYKRDVNDSTMKMARMAKEQLPEGIKLTKKQKEVVTLLLQVGAAAVKEICYFCAITEAVLNNLKKRGIIEYFQREVYRNPYKDAHLKKKSDRNSLTEKQNEIFNQLYEHYNRKTPHVSLFRGITGSGKTEIFLKLMEAVIEDGKQAIMMVPEISLTPQMVDLFQQKFGEDVAVMHSSLSIGERLDEWKRAKRGEAKVVVGTRSAVFAPFENIGLIIMDEEGESSYKSEAAPRYHAREVAKFRCVKHNAMLLLASATPSIESYYYAKTGRYSLYELEERYKEAMLPTVTIVDSRQENFQMNDSFISEALAEEIGRNLQKKEQTILLLNRRGYQTFASCLDCGEVINCPNCSVPLTYHKANGYMMCHYCGHSQKPVNNCPACHQEHIFLSGLGTQKIEDELHVKFPTANVLRMDTDTTFSRAAFEERFHDFALGAYDIMVGTQMIAKGLNFPNITLVGVLSADQSLYGNDFKCAERTFSLITQVVGRSGRGEKPGRAFIQTYTPENKVISLAAKQDYTGFYEDEIKIRKALLYPPFCDICIVGFQCESELSAKNAALSFISYMKQELQIRDLEIPIKVLGPSKASVYRINNKYRYRVVIKCKTSREFRVLLKSSLIQTSRDKTYSKVQVYADMNGDINS